MAMEQRFRNYSSDSVGSEGVFIEDSYNQGRLRAMDHRKGRVCVHFVSEAGFHPGGVLRSGISLWISSSSKSLCLSFALTVFYSGEKCV